MKIKQHLDLLCTYALNIFVRIFEMNTKLTLKLNESVIAKAKTYAKAKGTSLSGLIENYLQKITDEKKSKRDTTPLVKSLSGIIKLPKNYNEKKAYADYLNKKYN